MLFGWVDVSGDGWGGVFGVHVLRRGVRTSQIRLSDNTVPLFFGRPARAGRTLTVKGGINSDVLDALMILETRWLTRGCQPCGRSRLV